MITLSTIMVPPHVSVDDPFSSQYSRHSSSERYGLYAAPENFKEKQPATRSDTPVQCQPQEFAAHTDFKYDHEFHNDYSQHFVDSGQRPQNYIRSTSLATRFNEYPKLQELIKEKDNLATATAGFPWSLQADLRKLDLQHLQCKFDVIIVDPPWEE
ncbi:unnamed protein product [Umbelopsis sp. WA50703]